jgi:hypothetical protein
MDAKAQIIVSMNKGEKADPRIQQDPTGSNRSRQDPTGSAFSPLKQVALI